MPLIEEPVVATVHLDAKLRKWNDVPNELSPAHFEGTFSMNDSSSCNIEETLRKLTLLAMGDTEDASKLAEEIPESFSALFNSIVMLKSHTALARQEAAQAVEDAELAKRRAKVWKSRAVLLSQSNADIRKHADNLFLQQQRAAHEKTVLKRAYKQLAKDSAFDVSRYVEHAIALHEDHLQQQQKSSSDSASLEVTSATSISFDDTVEQDPEESPLDSSAVFVSPDPSDPYKPLQLQVNSASLQKQLLQKHRPRAKLRTDDLLEAPVSPRAVRNLTIPSIIYQTYS